MSDDRNANQDRGYPFDFAPDLPPDQNRPGKAIVRELDFEVTDQGDVLHLCYSQFQAEFNVGGEADLKTKLINIHKPDYSASAQVPKPNTPYNSKLSLKNNKLIYVIFKLKSSRNWQFSRRGWPISITERAKGYFFEAYRSDAKGVIDRGEDKFLIRDNCKVAYVIVDGEKASKKGAFCHPINLHIDLVNEVPGKDENGNDITTTCFLPIIVDPDIRYPGGSG